MLTRDAIEATLPLVDMLDARGLVLRPVPGSHLEALNRATRASSRFVVELGNGEIMPDVGNIEYVANAKNEQGFSEHDILCDELSTLCAGHVQNHISYARTVVAPSIMDMVEKVKTAQSISPSISSILGLEVVVWETPVPMTNVAVQEMVREYEGVSFRDPAFLFRMEAKSYPELVTLMETGRSSIDSDIRAWAAAKGESFFLEVWAQVFQGVVADGQSARSFYQMTSNDDNGADTALAVFLMARRLVDEVPEGTGMGLNAYTDAMVDFRDQAGLRLSVMINELQRDIQAGRLVRNVIGTKTIVTGPVYKSWIESGGSNEILFGNMLSNAPLYNLALINENAASLRAYWHRHETATVVAESRQKFNRDIATLRKVFMGQLHELTDPEEANQANLTVVQRLFEEELGRTEPEDFKNLFSLCARLICRSRFYQTDAEFILVGGERIKQDFPNIDPREAYAMVTIEYIIRWVLSQTKVGQA